MNCKGLIQRCSGGVLGKSTDTPNFIILGLDGAGKTTLLYRLKLPNWKRDELKKDMKDMRTRDKATDKILDPGYHYEEFTRPYSYGVWDVPGTDAMRHVWPAFYRSIKIHGVIFVVGVGKESKESEKGGVRDDMSDARIELARKNLHYLMNEDELRHAAFCVIINQRYKEEGDGKGLMYDEAEDELSYRLGIHDLHDSCKWRTKKFVINCLDGIKGTESNDWSGSAGVMSFLKATLQDSRGFGLNL
jgi:hypothetical protein